MTTATVRAPRFSRAGRRLGGEDVPVPQPGPGEVLVRIGACRICLSDVHMIDGSIDCPLEEVTPGHEPAGTIAEVGARVPYWQPGRGWSSHRGGFAAPARTAGTPRTGAAEFTRRSVRCWLLVASAPSSRSGSAIYHPSADVSGNGGGALVRQLA
ncbi:alcohol dehydrogenase catalytic domain-containing protein [Streptomyces sp. NPDC056291]|uniref:alcohol dehydrogenase catalytic domain-containing protein n=1 Tax=unclassified Streptomyces TaxID=2593676 RepID=UPI0035E04434